MKSAPRLNKQPTMTKEQFLIAWTLARASTLDRSPNVLGIAKDASIAWNEIQKLKEQK